MSNRRFFGLLCAHKWKIQAETPIIRTRDKACVGYIAVLQCDHCGDIKERRVSVA